MKNFFIKLFFYVSFVVFTFEGLILTLMAAGRLSVTRIELFLASFASHQDSNILFIAAGGFFLFALVFLISALKTYDQPPVIIIKDKNEVLRIPLETIKEFVNQIISMNSHIKNVEMYVTKKKRWVTINILAMYSGCKPVHEEIIKLREIVKGELQRIFEFPFLRINFQLEGISLEHNRGSLMALNQEEDSEKELVEKIEEKKDMVPPERETELDDFDDLDDETLPLEEEEDLEEETQIVETQEEELEVAREKMPWDLD